MTFKVNMYDGGWTVHICTIMRIMDEWNEFMSNKNHIMNYYNINDKNLIENIEF